MPTAAEHYQAGRLSAAVTEALAAVKAAPADRGKRWLLAELLAFDGDAERADKHFDFLAGQSDPPDLAAMLGRQLLRAETARREVFTQGRLPEFLTEPPEHVRLSLEALTAVRAQDAAAAGLLDRAEAARPVVSGTCDGQPFGSFRDLDDLTAGVFEVLTSNGNYYWVPFEAVEAVEFRPPARAKDLLWRSASLQVKDGPDGEVYFPALYVGSHSATDEGIKLGRKTEYAVGRPVRGSGLREYLVDDEPKTALEISTITFGG